MIVLTLVSAWAFALLLSLLDGRRASVRWGAVLALLISSGLAVGLAQAVATQGALQVTTGGWPAGLGITLQADALGVIFLVVSDASLLAALLYHVLGGEPSEHLPGLVLFLAAGLTGLFITADVFNFFVFFEVSMAAAFAMSAHGKDPREVTAAFLFVTLNIVGSALFLLAVGGLYHLTGSLSFAGVARGLSGSGTPLATGIGALLLAAFSLKLGNFPFHTWLPDVYRDLRPEVSAIFSGALANIGSYGLLRFGAHLMPEELAAAAWLFLGLGAASILYGGLAAIGAGTSQAVLAYSSIGQVGYILVALGIGGSAGAAAALVYAVVNAGNKTLLFLASGLRGPLSAAVFAAGAFSLAGIPPFAGFVAKAAIFRSAILAREWLVLGLLVLGSGLTFVYIFRVLQRDFWEGRQKQGSSRRRATPALGLALAAVLAGLGTWAEPLVRAGGAASAALEVAP